MSVKLFAAVQAMLKDKGIEYLDNPLKVEGYLNDMAYDEPKAERRVFLLCLEKKFHIDLKAAVAKDDRVNLKIKYVKLLCDEGFVENLCKATLDLLEAALFGKVTPTTVEKPASAPSPKIPKPPATTSFSSFVRIEGGTFIMGSPTTEAERETEEIEHKVYVSPFDMSKYALSQAGYESVMGYNPSSFKGVNLPVERVSWYDAVDYCNKRSRQEGLISAYKIENLIVTWNKDANGYRLPTEAEWEYACRAGTTTPFSTGYKIERENANYDGNYPYNGGAKGINRGKTTEVGKFKANPFGLYNMHGNVWEWCWDRYGDYNEETQINPIGAVQGRPRVIRGGSWASHAGYLRSAYRRSKAPDEKFSSIGFRLVRNCP